MVIISILIVISFIVYRWWIKSPQRKGKIGEKKVSQLLSLLPDEYKVLDDVVLKTKRGTTQIDHIVVSKYGVFAIETKNYRGEIYGDDNRKEWTQVIVTNVTYLKKWYKTYTYVTKNQFYNPVKQSLGHLYEIKNTLTGWPNLKMFSIVVFVGDADLSNVTSNSIVIYADDLLNTIMGNRTIYLSDADVDNIYNQLSLMNQRASVNNFSHVQNIQSAKRQLNNTIASGICPQCGGTLVKRTGRYGSFYGCSNYPNCKFTIH